MNTYDEARKALKNGKIVIFPTDTAIGIGCRMDRKDSVERLFKLRKRPETKPTPVLVSSIDMAKEYLTDIPLDVLHLMKRYWPGGLTIVFQCRTEKVLKLVRGGTETLGVRMPNHPRLLSLIEKVGVPILCPSANFHGGKTPYKTWDLDPFLVSQVDYILKEDATGLKASTVIDCTKNPWKVIRPGAIDITV